MVQSGVALTLNKIEYIFAYCIYQNLPPETVAKTPTQFCVTLPTSYDVELVHKTCCFVKKFKKNQILKLPVVTNGFGKQCLQTAPRFRNVCVYDTFDDAPLVHDFGINQQYLKIMFFPAGKIFKITYLRGEKLVSHTKLGGEFFCASNRYFKSKLRGKYYYSLWFCISYLHVLNPDVWG